MSTHIVSFRELHPDKRIQVTAEILRDPILILLEQRGPLATNALIYLLEQEYDILIGANSLNMALRILRRAGDIIETQLDLDHDFAFVYCLPGDQERTPGIPAYINYETAYIELYLRYQGIRENPALVTAPEGYLVSLFNPRRNQEAEDQA